jgi:hypothetical protein
LVSRYVIILGARVIVPSKVQIGFAIKIKFIPQHLIDCVGRGASLGHLILWHILLTGILGAIGGQMRRRHLLAEALMSALGNVGIVKLIDELLCVNLETLERIRSSFEEFRLHGEPKT